MSGLLVFDTEVLSNFALSDALDVLKTRYGGRGIVTSEVLDEVISGVVAGFSELRAIDRLVEDGEFRMVVLDRTQRRKFAELRKSLGTGEASCIAWAERNKVSVATDDRLAREVCRQLNIACTGIIGILVKASREGQIVLSDGEAILQRMVSAGFYSPIRRLAEIV